MASNSSTSPPAAPSPPKSSPAPSAAPPPSASSPPPPSPPAVSSSPAPPEPSDSSPPPPPRSRVSPFSPARTRPPSPPEQSSRGSRGGGSPPPPVSTRRGGPTLVEVVFAAAGAVALLVILIAACVCCSRRTAPRRRKRPHNPMHYYADSSSAYKGNYTSGTQQQWQSDAGAAATTSSFGPPAGGWHSPPPDMTSVAYSSSSSPQPPPSPHEALGLGKGSFTYEQLAAATANFSPANLLGQGGFGYVHRGVLPGGRAVAVKQLKSGSGQGEREFQAEVDIISRVHHRHLVSLVGYCIAGARRMLVYEFVPNRTLEFHLHGKGQPVMEWPTRLRIALGAAKGLAYLHEDCHPRIIHRDIKSANVLLDHNFEAMLLLPCLPGRGLRAGQAELRHQHARLDPRHGHVRVPGAGVRVEREADGEVGRLLLRRDAAGAPHGAAARRRRHRHQLVPRGQPRRLGEAGLVARAGRRRLRRRRGPEAARQLRPRGDGAARRQRRGRRAPLGQEAPQDEPDREGAGGGHVAGGPERGGTPRAEHDVRHGGVGGLVQGRGSRAVHVGHGADQAGDRGDPGVRRRRGHRVRPYLADRKRGALRRRRFESGEGSIAQVAVVDPPCTPVMSDGCDSCSPRPLLIARTSCSGVCEQLASSPPVACDAACKLMYIPTLITRRMCR